MATLNTRLFSNTNFVHSKNGYAEKFEPGAQKIDLLNQLYSDTPFASFIRKYNLIEVEDNIRFEYDYSKRPRLSLKLVGGRTIVVPYETVYKELGEHAIQIMRDLLELAVPPRSQTSRNEGELPHSNASSSSDKTAELFERLFMRTQESNDKQNAQLTGIVHHLIKSQSKLPVNPLQPCHHVQTHQSQIETLLKKIDQLETKVAFLEEGRQREINYLNGAISSQTEALQQVSDINQNLYSENGNLKQQIAQLNKEKNELTQRLEEMQQKEVSLEEKCDQLTRHLADKNKELDQANSKNKIAIENKEREIEAFEKILLKKLEENDRLQKALLSQTAQIEALKLNTDKLASLHSNHTSSIASLQYQIEVESENFQEAFDEKKNALTDALKANEDLHSELQKMRNQCVANETSQGELQSKLDQTIALTQEQNEQLAALSGQLKNTDEKFQNTSNAQNILIEQLQEKLQSADLNLRKFHGELHLAQEKIEQADKEIIASQESRGDLQKKLEKLRSEHSKDLEEATKQLSLAQLDKSQLQETLTLQLKEFDQIRADLLAAKGLIKDLEIEHVNQLNDVVEQIQAKYNLLLDQLKQEKEVIQKNGAESEAAFQSQLANLNLQSASEIASLKDTVQALQRQLLALSGQLRSADEKFQNTNNAQNILIEQLQEKLQSADLNLKKFHEELQLAQEKIEQADKEIIASQESRNDLQNELEKLRSEHSKDLEEVTKQLSLAQLDKSQLQDTLTLQLKEFDQIRADLLAAKGLSKDLEIKHKNELNEVVEQIQAKYNLLLDQLKQEKEVIEKNGAESKTVLQFELANLKVQSASEIADLNGTVQALQAQLTELTSELANVRETLSKEKEESASLLTTELEQVKKQLATAEKELEEKQDLEQRVRDLVEENLLLNGANKRLQAGITQGEKDLQTNKRIAEEAIEEKDREISQLTDDYNAVVENANNKISEINTNIAILQADAETQTKIILQLEARIKSLNSEISDLELDKLGSEEKMQKQEQSNVKAEIIVQTLKKELAEREAALIRERSELENKENLLNQAQKKLSQIPFLQAHIEQVSKDFESANHLVDRHKAIEQFLHLEMDKRNKKIAADQNKLEELRNRREADIAALEKKLKEQEETLNQAGKAGIELEDRYNDLVDENDKLKENLIFAREKINQRDILFAQMAKNQLHKSSSGHSSEIVDLTVEGPIFRALGNTNEIKKHFKKLISEKDVNNESILLNHDLITSDLDEVTFDETNPRNNRLFHYLSDDLIPKITKAQNSHENRISNACLFTAVSPAFSAFLKELSNHLSNDNKPYLKSERDKDAESTAKALYDLLLLHPPICGELTYLKYLLEQVADVTNNDVINNLNNLYANISPLLNELFGDLDLSEPE